MIKVLISYFFDDQNLFQFSFISSNVKYFSEGQERQPFASQLYDSPPQKWLQFELNNFQFNHLIV